MRAPSKNKKNARRAGKIDFEFSGTITLRIKAKQRQAWITSDP